MFEIIKKIDYEKLKEKGAPLAIAGVCFVAVFIAGFGTGRVSNGEVSTSPAKRSLTNYTTNTEDKSKLSANNNTTPKISSTEPSTKPTVETTPVDPNNCYIKGSKSKTYHMPGGSFYERTNPAACFNSEEEAVVAGYKKSSR